MGSSGREGTRGVGLDMSDVEQEATEQPVAEKDAAPAAGPNRVEQEAMEQPLDDHDDAPAIPNRKKEIFEQNRMYTVFV